MAASPIQVDNVKQEEQSWSRPDDQSAGAAAPPPSNGDALVSSNGVGNHSDDKHDVKQPTEVASYERANTSAPEGTSSSPAKQDVSHRGEKQIKVLVESYFVIAVTPVFVLSWHLHKIVSKLSALACFALPSLSLSVATASRLAIILIDYDASLNKGRP